MRFITGLLVTGLLSSSVFKVGAVAPKSEVNDTIVDLRPLVYEQPFQRKADKITDAKWFQMTYVGVPLVIAGLSVKHGSEHFRQLREDFVPNFHYGYDDYLQYAPAVVMLGLKGFGVESRSSWGRMLVSDAFSVAIMASVVNTIKYTAHVRRPDKSNYKSFPSGHTATAFMAAMMMHKEYGDRSPWYSISAFTVATATGISRILNNRHWLSDVLAGAGIGILSTELGYYLADLIFKDKGLNFESPRYYPLLENPSFVGLYMGFVSGLGSIDLGNGLRINTNIGSRMGVEGAYPFTRRWSLGCKALAGYSYILDRSIGRDEIKLGNNGFAWSAGVSVGYVLKRNFGARLFCDYSSTSTSLGLSPSTELGIMDISSKNRTIHALTWGATANILF